MSENNDERIKKLREEVNLLREQLLRVSEQLEEPQEEAEEGPEEDVSREVPVEAPGEEPQEEEPEKEDEWFDEDEPYYRRRKPRKRIEIRGPFPGEDFGDRLGDYIGDFVEDVMEGVTSELERSLFWESRPGRERPTVMSDSEVQRIAAVMSALGNEHRIKILKELTWGGLYVSDLQDTLKEISASTLSSHLDVLQEAGLIVQERRRGRYLITMSGRLAIKMASSIAKRVDGGDSPRPRPQRPPRPKAEDLD
jgi:DNA-binding transcriptional ArsR family regulator